jgi:hypothetical protein
MFAMLPHTQSDKEREHVKGDAGSTQVLASSMRPVVSCISMVSDSSNGLSNISTFWSDGWPSTSDSLEGEDVLSSWVPQGSEQCSPFQSSAPILELENGLVDLELTVPTRLNRPVSDFRKYKTTLCRSWTASSMCMFGGECIFAHGEAELRSETNNETLKLAHELLGGAQERLPRRRTRRRHRRKTQSSSCHSGTPEDVSEAGEKDEDDAVTIPAGESPLEPQSPYSSPAAPPEGPPPPPAFPDAPASSDPLSPPSLPSPPAPASSPPGSCPGQGRCLQDLYTRLQWLEHESESLRHYLNAYLPHPPPPAGAPAALERVTPAAAPRHPRRPPKMAHQPSEPRAAPPPGLWPDQDPLSGLLYCPSPMVRAPRTPPIPIPGSAGVARFPTTRSPSGP